MRTSALAGTNSADKNSIADLNTNPASLVSKSQSISISLSSYILDTQYGQISYCYPLSDTQLVAFSVMTLFSTNFEYREADGLLIGDYSSSDVAISVSFIEQKFSPDLSIALTGKLVQSSIQDYNSSAFLISISSLYHPDFLKNHQFALKLDNIGFHLKKFDLVEETLPFAINFAYSYRLKKAPIKFLSVFNHLENKSPFGDFAAGLEIQLYDFIQFRISYERQIHISNQLRNERNLFAGIATGFGIQKDSHQIDIAYANQGYLGNQFSISYQKTFD